MTIVLNEIHIIDGLENTFMIAAADRRITWPNGKKQTWKKMFKIPYLYGAISFYGRADFFPQGKKDSISFSTWLPNFINRNSNTGTLENFSNCLRDELNRIIPSNQIGAMVSGFHICGYNAQGYPDFWSLSNYETMTDFEYVGIKNQYKTPANDFLSGDAKSFGWDGIDPFSINSGQVMIYRNGDVRAHAKVFDNLNDIYKYLSSFPDFKTISDFADYRDFIKFKLEIIAYIYKKLAKKPIIGTPIDIWLLEKP